MTWKFTVIFLFLHGLYKGLAINFLYYRYKDTFVYYFNQITRNNIDNKNKLYFIKPIGAISIWNSYIGLKFTGANRSWMFNIMIYFNFWIICIYSRELTHNKEPWHLPVVKSSQSNQPCPCIVTPHVEDLFSDPEFEA